jgi:predicted PurR-regulated permease PerM
MTTDSPVPQPYEWTFRRVVWTTLVFAFVVFCFWLVFRFYEVVFTLFIAIVFGTVIRPLAERLAQRGLPRIAAVLVVYLAFLLVLAGFLWLVFPLLAAQVTAISSELPGLYQSLRDGLINSSNLLFSRFGASLPALLPFGTPAGQTTEDVMDSAAQFWLYLTTIAQIFVAVIVVPALTLYWTLDGPRIIKSLLLLIPRDQRDGISDLIATMEAKIGYYLLGQAILSFVVGGLALIAYLLIGLPNALVLALIAGVLEAVPMIGPFLGAIPAALVALPMGTDRFIWVLVASLIIQQLENAILVPRIMSRTVGVNPFVTLLALFAFGTLFGVAGAFMAIPLAVIIQLILDHFVFKQTNVTMEPAEGRDHASRVRYEAQHLVQDLRKQARERKRGSEEKVQQTEHVMDEIEAIAANLDELLAQSNSAEDG